MTDANAPTNDVDPEDVRVFWQPPRQPFEDPLLVVGEGLNPQWYVRIDSTGVATVAVKKWLAESDAGEIETHAEQVAADESIPAYVAQALLDYDGQHVTVRAVLNPHPELDDDDDGDVPALDDAQETLVPDGGEEFEYETRDRRVVGTRRVAEQCYAALDQLRDIQPETERQEEKLKTAITAVREIAELDKERHGETPTDKLIQALKNRKEGA